MAADDHLEDESPWRQRGFMLAAAFVGAIVAVGIVLALSGGGDDEPDARAPVTSPTTASTASTAQASDSACGLPNSDEKIPTTAPSGTQWELVGTMAAPQARDSYGPARTTRGVPTCFARSPIGALYASVNFWASGTAAAPATVYRVLALDNNVRDRVLASANSQGDQRLDDRGTLQVAGYRYNSYDKNVAAIDLAFRLADGRLVRFPTTMRWASGDWKFEISPNGRSGGTNLETIEGYVRWSGA